MDSAAPPGLSLVTVCSLLACCLQVLAAVLLTHRYGGQSSAEDRWVLLWLFYDVIVHLTLEGPFVYMSLVGTVETSEGPLAELCELNKHFLQVALSVCELYGGWMTFCPDWLMGSPHLDTSSRLYLWVYLVFFNGLWVLVPVLLLVQSWFCLRSLHALRTDTDLKSRKNM
uniref:EBP like n=1 Tax=Acanthochromis polyacanthus TaxID=80966 RepID=A0A3Q1EWH6_9TELE